MHRGAPAPTAERREQRERRQQQEQRRQRRCRLQHARGTRNCAGAQRQTQTHYKGTQRAQRLSMRELTVRSRLRHRSRVLRERCAPYEMCVVMCRRAMTAVVRRAAAFAIVSIAGREKGRREGRATAQRRKKSLARQQQRRNLVLRQSHRRSLQPSSQRHVVQARSEEGGRNTGAHARTDDAPTDVLLRVTGAGARSSLPPRRIPRAPRLILCHLLSSHRAACL